MNKKNNKEYLKCDVIPLTVFVATCKEHAPQIISALASKFDLEEMLSDPLYVVRFDDKGFFEIGYSDDDWIIN